MKNKLRAFASAWSGRKSGSAKGLELKDTPAYPLARTVEMPEGHDYPHGALAFRMKSQKLTGLDRLDATRSSVEVEGDLVTLRLVFDRLELGARYVIESKPDPLVALDVGGHLMDLPDDALQPVAAGADDPQLPGSGWSVNTGDPLDPTQEKWIGQAKDQRDNKLDVPSNPNGQQMVGAFKEHNDAYLAAFQRSSVQTVWQQDGTVKDMSAHTSEVDGTANKVNPPKTEKSFGTNNAGYNETAFEKKTAIASALGYLAFQTPGISEEEKQAYLAAAKAAVDFNNHVATTGNNDQGAENPMSFDEVHGAVQSHTELAAAPATEDDVRAHMEMAPEHGGADEKSGARPLLNERHREIARQMQESLRKEDAANAAIVGEPLFEGSCTARIDGAEATVELVLDQDGSRARAVSADVVLPAFALDVDDSDWTGVAGDTARQRLSEMYFIRSLTHEAIADELEQALVETVPGVYDAAANCA